MHASIGQYSIQAGEPAQPVQQSVVIARMRGFFLRVALPSPSDMGQCFSTMSKMFGSSNTVMRDTLTQGLFGTQSESSVLLCGFLCGSAPLYEDCFAQEVISRKDAKAPRHAKANQDTTNQKVRTHSALFIKHCPSL